MSHRVDLITTAVRNAGWALGLSLHVFHQWGQWNEVNVTNHSHTFDVNGNLVSTVSTPTTKQIRVCTVCWIHETV